jgi:hypothetical protein
MDNKKRRLQKITGIFVVLEAVFLYYLVGLLLAGYRPGHLLLGWKDLNVGLDVANPLKYFPGLIYVLKTFFPLYFDYVYRVPPSIPLSLNAINQGYATLNFFSLFWIGLIIAIVLTAILYAVRIRSKIFLGGTLVLMSILPIIFSIYPVMGNGLYFRWAFSMQLSILEAFHLSVRMKCCCLIS